MILVRKREELGIEIKDSKIEKLQAIVSMFTSILSLFIGICLICPNRHLPYKSAYVATSTPLASWRSQPLTTKHRPVLQRQMHCLALVRINFTVVRELLRRRVMLHLKPDLF